MTGRIVVVGSANLDIVVPVPHHPATGETVLGGDHRLIPGGKGANQAVAAARLGRAVSFVGRVGTDDAGTTLRTALEADGVDVSHVVADPDAPSGIALIGVDDDGDNAIIVSPGANSRITAAQIDDAAPALADADVVLVQLEIPLDSVTRVAEIVADGDGLLILNPAPAPGAPLPVDLLDRCDLVVPNRLELAQLAGTDAHDDDGIVDAARSLGVPTVVVTMGGQGARVVSRDLDLAVPAPTITPVDTTAAGDSFCGALADALARRKPVEDAVRWAVAAGASTATRAGAQPSLPTASEVVALQNR